ncbi:uncharacterized protein LOC119599924 [Lucilia sericata]|uniref:uncharacterized protein LOC119599924 n=1 Tax=Lucilia sericata TaxID=13632 RepID=UPI0018A881CF|nr:uncharacterized protein LOC119599924 [Lucilia sericata]
MPEISHESTPGSTAAEQSTFNGFIKREKSAFKNRIITLSYNINNEQCLIPEILLKKAGREFMEEVYKFLKLNIGLKFNVELHALYAKPNLDDLENTPLDVKSFQTKMKEMFDISEFEVKFTNNIGSILQKMEEFQERDSGWTLVQLIKVVLNINKYQPLKGSSYISLPKKFIGDNTMCHYVWIKSISRLIRNQQTKRKEKVFVCDDCLQHFHLIEKLVAHQKNCGQKVSYVPEKDKSTLEFQNYCNSMDVPFVVYADSECIFENIQTCIPNMDSSSTTLVDKHIPYAFSYYIKCAFDNSLSKLRSFKGFNSAKLFIENLVSDAKFLNDNYLKNIIPMAPLTEEENLDFYSNNICHICSKNILNEEKVRDHCHLSGKYRGPAHNTCNINYKLPSFIPVIFHNFSAYDCHLFVKELNNIDDGPINIIPLNKELYISLSKTINSDNGRNIEIRFLDSYRFMTSSLDNLVKNLTQDELKVVKEFHSDDKSKFNLLIRKGVFPYTYINSVEKLQEPCLPTIDEFFNKLTESECSIEDYAHAQKVWNTFECKTLEDYLMLYLRSDVLLLADVFENFRLVCKNIYNLDPCHYYTAPGLSWDAMLKITNIKLDLLTDIEMINFLQKGIRGGIVQCSQRHSVANNKYLSDYNDKLPSKYLTYLDANNLYGWAMSQSLPECDFEWIEDIRNFSLESIPIDSDTGYILEVDLIYPIEIHDSHNNLPFCCENKAPPSSKEKKLIVDLTNKHHYNPKI